MSEQTPETPPEAVPGDPESPDTEEEEATEEEPAQPQEPSQRVPAVDMEKAIKALDSEQSRHDRAVAKIMGDDFEAFKPCFTCGSLGFVPITASPLDQLRYDADASPCKRCDAQGLLLTGSKVQGNETKMCPDCAGAGYVMPSNVHEFVPAAPQVDEDPRVAALKAEGYFVTPPYRPEANVTP